MTPEERILIAAQLRAVADRLLLASASTSSEVGAMAGMVAPPTTTAQPPKRKRKPSAYGRAYGAAYKRLRRKHPRAQHKTIVKRAHAAARKKTGRR